MKPAYGITPKILKLITSISEKLGEVKANYLNKQSPQLRKQNRIKTIHSSLQIEGTTLIEQQITALIDHLFTVKIQQLNSYYLSLKIGNARWKLTSFSLKKPLHQLPRFVC